VAGNFDRLRAGQGTYTDSPFNTSVTNMRSVFESGLEGINRAEKVYSYSLTINR